MKHPITQRATDDAAAILDTFWGDPADPVLPVDPFRIARSLGLGVVASDLDPEIAGSIVKDPGYDPLILLNRLDSRRRMRVTCAHELGHYAASGGNPDDYEFVDYRDMLSGPEPDDADDDERYAHAFAAALLMPERVMRRLARRARSEIELAWRLGVSREAVHHRLERLGVAVG